MHLCYCFNIVCCWSDVHLTCAHDLFHSNSDARRRTKLSLTTGCNALPMQKCTHHPPLTSASHSSRSLRRLLICCCVDIKLVQLSLQLRKDESCKLFAPLGAACTYFILNQKVSNNSVFSRVTVCFFALFWQAPCAHTNPRLVRTRNRLGSCIPRTRPV